MCFLFRDAKTCCRWLYYFIGVAIHVALFCFHSFLGNAKCRLNSVYGTENVCEIEGKSKLGYLQSLSGGIIAYKWVCERVESIDGASGVTFVPDNAFLSNSFLFNGKFYDLF